MILISHRGNIYGPNRRLENTEGYVEKARKSILLKLTFGRLKMAGG